MLHEATGWDWPTYKTAKQLFGMSVQSNRPVSIAASSFLLDVVIVFKTPVVVPLSEVNDQYSFKKHFSNFTWGSSQPSAPMPPQKTVNDFRHPSIVCPSINICFVILIAQGNKDCIAMLSWIRCVTPQSPFQIELIALLFVMPFYEFLINRKL